MKSNVRVAHKTLIAELRGYAKPNTAKGLKVFLIDFTLFWLSLAGVVLLPSLPLKIAASLFAGSRIGALIAIAHEAAHNALVVSRRLNWWIAVLSFAPGLFNYRLWLFDHHHLHHAATNAALVNSYQPMTLAEYEALSAWGRWKIRFFRSGNPLSFGIYYITQRWWLVNFKPGSFLPARMQASARKHFFGLSLYAAASLAFFAFAAPQIGPVSAPVAILLGFFAPFFVGQSLFAVVLYIQHTHPDIPWIAAMDEGKNPDLDAQIDAEHLSFHLFLPTWASAIAHHSLEHPVHHVMPLIPCYELRAAQARMNELMGSDAFVEAFSAKRLLDTFRICKLYDYERRQWIGFDGVPTAPAWVPFDQRPPVEAPSPPQ